MSRVCQFIQKTVAPNEYAELLSLKHAHHSQSSQPQAWPKVADFVHRKVRLRY